ncbi:MAG: hypothetical protein V3G42_14435 [Oscillospiraceae bacterium]
MKKMFSLLLTLVMLNCGITVVPVVAEETFDCEETIAEESIITASYLISNYNLNIYKNGSILYVNALTGSNSTMKTIGFKDVTVEYSTNCSDWYEYRQPFDYTVSSASSCYMTNYPISVTNGYYYRVTLNHYAEASGLFGSSQSVYNTSNVVS